MDKISLDLEVFLPNSGLYENICNYWICEAIYAVYQLLNAKWRLVYTRGKKKIKICIISIGSFFSAIVSILRPQYF